MGEASEVTEANEAAEVLRPGKTLLRNSVSSRFLIFDRSTCSKQSKESLWCLLLQCTSLCHLLNFSVFHHVFISSLDMFKNCINSYHNDSEQV